MKITLSKYVYFIESLFLMMTGMNELNYSFVTKEDTETFFKDPNPIISVWEMA